MSEVYKNDKATVQSSVFRVPKVPAPHKSWHRKAEDSLCIRRLAAQNINEYKEKTTSIPVRTKTSCNSSAHQVSSTSVPQESMKTYPHMLVSNTIKGDEERVSTNIHINPLFALKDVEKNVKSWQQLPNKLPVAVSQSSSASDNTVSQSSFKFKIPNLSLTRSLSTSRCNGAGTSERLNTGVTTACTVVNHGESQSRPNTTVNPAKTLNRPSIHVNPSILVSNRIQFPSDGNCDTPNHLRSDIINLYNTLQSLPNTKVPCVHINPLHSTNASAKPIAIERDRLARINPLAQDAGPPVHVAIEPQISVHINPLVLGTNVVVKSVATEPQRSVHINPLVHNTNAARPIAKEPQTYVHINPLVLGANMVAKPIAPDPQRSVHINPAVLASHAAKKAAHSKTSVHINPKVYARLKSEVHREKPKELIVYCSSSIPQVSVSNNKSEFKITRTKLIRSSLPRTRRLSTRKIQQSTFQPPCSTPKMLPVCNAFKVRKVSCLKTPPSTVVKTAKSVCSKYKFIRKSFQINTLSVPSAPSKVPPFAASIYKLDRRSQKTPKCLKKVKPFSIKYEGSRSNNMENPLRIINKKVISSKKLSLASRVWRNPKSLSTKKTTPRNRKLFKIGTSPTQKTEGNQSSSHKTLVRLGGVLYKTSRMKLTRSRTPRNKYTRSRMDSKTSYKPTRKSLNRSCILNVRGDKFLMDPLGRTLKRISTDKPRGMESTKRIDIGGVTFIQKSKNVLIRTNTHTVRNVLSQAKNKSIALLTMRMRKNNAHCKFYRRLGKCTGKEKGRCPCIHDPKYVMICKKLLKGECCGDGCLLSHELIPEKMPACKFFIEGCCSRDVCPYLHVRTDFDAPICTSFLQGYCQDGSECMKKHLYVCPLFYKYGKCSKNKYCPYPHKSKESFKLDVDHAQTNGDILDEAKGDEQTMEGFRYFRFNPEPDIRVGGKVGTDVLDEGETRTDARIQHIDKLFDEAMNFAQISDIESVKNIVNKITELRSYENSAKHDLEQLINIHENEAELRIELDSNIIHEVAITDTMFMSKIRAESMPADEWRRIVHSIQEVRQQQGDILTLIQEMANDRKVMLEGKEETELYELATFDLAAAIQCICEEDETNNDDADPCDSTEGAAREESCREPLLTPKKTEAGPQPTRDVRDVGKNKNVKMIGVPLINYIVQTCEKVRCSFSAASPHDEDSDAARLFMLEMCNEVRLELSKVIETPSEYAISIGKDSTEVYYDIPSCLRTLLRKLLRFLTELHRVAGLYKEASALAVSTLLVPEQTCVHGNCDWNDATPPPCADLKTKGGLVTNFLSKRPKIGSLPSYIPFN